jgi:pimeloyl-ACP methyl ester carboxylesterase
LTPRRDIFITPASQIDISRWAADSQVHEVEGGHWVPAFNPAVIADRVRSFITERARLNQIGEL